MSQKHTVSKLVITRSQDLDYVKSLALSMLRRKGYDVSKLRLVGTTQLPQRAGNGAFKFICSFK